MNRFRIALPRLWLVAAFLFTFAAWSSSAAVGQVPLAGGVAAPRGVPSAGAMTPRYFGPAYSGFGTYGFGVYGPGYYGRGAWGYPGVAPHTAPIDPSLYYHTYPYQTSPGHPSAGLRPTLPYPSRPWWGAPSVPPRSRGKIVIAHEKSADESVEYTLNGYRYQIQPGYVQQFEDDRTWVIAFDGEAPEKPIRYTLTAGRYRFLKRETGWDLVREPDEKATAESP